MACHEPWHNDTCLPVSSVLGNINTGRSRVQGRPRSTDWVPGQPGLHRESQSQKQNKTKKPINQNQNKYISYATFKFCLEYDLILENNGKKNYSQVSCWLFADFAYQDYCSRYLNDDTYTSPIPMTHGLL